MAKDVFGNVLSVGDRIVYNNILCTIKELNENRVLGGRNLSSKSINTIKIPDVMVLESEITFDTDKPVNCFAVKYPESPEDKVTKQ